MESQRDVSLSETFIMRRVSRLRTGCRSFGRLDSPAHVQTSHVLRPRPHVEDGEQAGCARNAVVLLRWKGRCRGPARGTFDRSLPGLTGRRPLHTAISRPHTTLRTRAWSPAIDEGATATSFGLRLGRPQTERWMAAHVGKLDAAALVGVGATFDIHAGILRQAPRWMQRSGTRELAFRSS